MYLMHSATAFGGGIYVHGLATLTVSRSVLEATTAFGTGSSLYVDGASDVTFADSVLMFGGDNDVSIVLMCGLITMVSISRDDAVCLILF